MTALAGARRKINRQRNTPQVFRFKHASAVARSAQCRRRLVDGIPPSSLDSMRRRATRLHALRMQGRIAIK
jgi:hypothetical protein